MRTLAAAVLTLAACQPAELDPNAFVGRWDCGESTVVLTETRYERDGVEAKIAFIETGKNADFAMTFTDGERVSLFDVTGRGMTLHAFADAVSLSCRRQS